MDTNDTTEPLDLSYGYGELEVYFIYFTILYLLKMNITNIIYSHIVSEITD